MIKGVNKRIIEIQNTDNKYFERAILIVSEEYQKRPKPELEKNGQQFLNGLISEQKNGILPGYHKTGRKRIIFIRALICLLILSGLVSLFIYLF